MFPKSGPKPPKTPKPLQRYTALRPFRKGKEPKRSTLRHGRSTPPPTAAQQRRFVLIKEIGCIACRVLGIVEQGCEIHHQTLGGKAGQRRLGHDYTIGLCTWHHRAGRPPGVTFAEMLATFGPPLTRARLFREKFGTDAELLDAQNELLERQ
jgi:hypothetical protein